MPILRHPDAACPAPDAFDRCPGHRIADADITALDPSPAGHWRPLRIDPPHRLDDRDADVHGPGCVIDTGGR